MPDKPKDAGKQPDSSFIQLDDVDKKGAASAASAPRRKALLGVLTAACIALIVVSLGFVHPSESGAWSIDWIVQTVTGESIVTKDVKAFGSTVASGKAESKGSKSSDDASDGSKDSDESDSKNDSESSDKESDKGSDGKKTEGQDGKKSGNKGAGNKKPDGSQSTSQNSTSSAGTSSASGSSSASGGASSAPDNGSASTGNQGGSQESSYVTVTVSVTSSAVGNPVSSGGTFTFNEGATVYDALCALGLSVNAENSPLYHGVYVKAIGGLAEKEHGGSSGWCYSVNGAQPMTACSNYVLSNGDNVVWYYVTG